MPNFSIPNNISPGDTSDANKAMANWNQIVNDLNGGKIDATNTAASFAKDNVEPAFSDYKVLEERNATFDSSFGAGVQVPLLQGGAALITSTNNLILANTVFYFDPARYTAGSRAVKLRVRFAYLNGPSPQPTTFTAGLYPITAIGSGGTLTAGTVTSGSTVAVATPAANATSAPDSGDFAAPTAGFYVLGVNLAGTATGVLLTRLALEMHQV